MTCLFTAARCLVAATLGPQGHCIVRTGVWLNTGPPGEVTIHVQWDLENDQHEKAHTQQITV